MAILGSVTTRVGSTQNSAPSIPTDEKVGGILFDISGFDSPFENYSQLQDNFGSGQVNLINNLNDAELLGLKDNGFLNGLVYYHLSSFYKYVNSEAPLFIAFADCSSDWSFIYTMQRACNGKMFQLGIWTHQRLWRIDTSTGLIDFSNLITNIENVAEELSGKVGQPSLSPIPLNIILNANTNFGDIRNFTLKELPNGLTLNAPKISVVLCQNGTDKVLAMQDKMPDTAPVGSIGLAMAILYLAGAEESIGNVENYNINKYDNFENPEIAVNNNHFPLEEISKTTLGILTAYGYITPISYIAKEGEFFFNGDSTFSTGDYSSIANNRIMHKCRRAVFSVLLPYLHSNHPYNGADGGLSPTAIQMFYEEIDAALSGKMVNKGGNYQINGYRITNFDSSDLLNNDSITIQYTVGPVNYNSTITDSVIVQ